VISQRARFLINFKNKGGNKNIKIRDLELRLDREEPRENVIDYVKSRLKASL
jgi:hypothetical protein